MLSRYRDRKCFAYDTLPHLQNYKVQDANLLGHEQCTILLHLIYIPLLESTPY